RGARSGSRSGRGRRRSAGPAAERRAPAAAVRREPAPGTPARRRPAAPGRSPPGCRTGGTPSPCPGPRARPARPWSACPLPARRRSRAPRPAGAAGCARRRPARRAAVPRSRAGSWAPPYGRNINGVKSAYALSVDLSPRKDQPMSTTVTPDHFTTLPDEHTLQATVVALEEHGFSVEAADDLDAAREAVLARIPHGSSVMTNTSVTLAETGIADAINDGDGRWESARNKMFALDFATQAQEMKAIGGQPDYALGSVHAITPDGTLVIASASGSQLASYAWGAASVIFVAGAHKLVPTLEAAHQRIYQHSLKLEDARAQAAYGQHSQV